MGYEPPACARRDATVERQRPSPTASPYQHPQTTLSPESLRSTLRPFPGWPRLATGQTRWAGAHTPARARFSGIIGIGLRVCSSGTSRIMVATTLIARLAFITLQAVAL